MILNQRRWQSLGGQHGKDVDGLFEKVIFHCCNNNHNTQEDLKIEVLMYNTHRLVLKSF